MAFLKEAFVANPPFPPKEDAPIPVISGDEARYTLRYRIEEAARIATLRFSWLFNSTEIHLSSYNGKVQLIPEGSTTAAQSHRTRNIIEYDEAVVDDKADIQQITLEEMKRMGLNESALSVESEDTLENGTVRQTKVYQSQYIRHLSFEKDAITYKGNPVEVSWDVRAN
jgi:hypothetical protein